MSLMKQCLPRSNTLHWLSGSAVRRCMQLDWEDDAGIAAVLRASPGGQARTEAQWGTALYLYIYFWHSCLQMKFGNSCCVACIGICMHAADACGLLAGVGLQGREQAGVVEGTCSSGYPHVCPSLLVERHPSLAQDVLPCTLSQHQ